MKFLAICGSPRINGNTEIAISKVLDKLKSYGHETELVRLADLTIGGCIACEMCRQKKDQKCYGKKDDLNLIIDKVKASDGLIIGTPVYFGSASPEIMATLDRIGYVNRTGESFLKHKIGASIAVARRAGQNFTFAQLNFFFMINEMVQIGSSYWNILFGRQKGEVLNDQEGITTLEKLAENINWLADKIKSE